MKSRPENAHDKISSFWKWFADHSTELASADIPQDLVGELEKRLFTIHRLDWEIGPGRNVSNLFALSPRGNSELLQLTRSIIAQAPMLVGWELWPAKPPRDWNLVFSLIVNGTSVEIDGKLWEFVAYKFKDGTHDLVLKPDSIKGLSEDYLYWAATIIADGELGEEARMELITNTEVVTSWDERAAKSAKKLRPSLLAKLLKP